MNSRDPLESSVILKPAEIPVALAGMGSNSIVPYLYVLIATIFYTGLATLVKLLTRLPSNEAVAARAIMTLLINCSILTYEKVPLKEWVGTHWKQQLFLLGRGCFGSVGMIGTFYAFERIDLGSASAIRYTSPIWTSILAFAILNENLTWIQLIAIPLTVVGSIFVIRPAFLFGNAASHEHSDGYIVALLAALGAASAYVFVRTINYQFPQTHSLTIVNYLQIASLVFSITISYAVGEPFLVPTFDEWINLLTMGVFGFAGQLFFTLGLRGDNAGPVDAIRTLQIFFCFVIQEVFFKSVDNLGWCIAGATLIVLCTGSMAIQKYYRSRYKAIPDNEQSEVDSSI